MTTQSEANDAQVELNRIEWYRSAHSHVLKALLLCADDDRVETEAAINDLLDDLFLDQIEKLTETANAIEDKYDADHNRSFREPN